MPLLHSLFCPIISAPAWQSRGCQVRVRGARRGMANQAGGGGGGERMVNDYVVPWDRGVDRFLGGEDVMVYTVREHEALVGLGGSTLQYGGGGEVA